MLFVEPKPNESPTEYNVDVVTLASRQLQSPAAATTSQESSSKDYAEPTRKQKKTIAAVSEIQILDSPAKNTRRAGKKRYYEELDHDEDSEEEFKPPIEEDNSSNEAEQDIDGKPTTTTGITNAKLKKQHVARAGGALDVEFIEDEEDEEDEDYNYQDNAEAELDLDDDSYVELDKYEVEMLKKESISNKGTATSDGSGEEASDEEDADGEAVEVTISVDPVEQRQIHKRDFYKIYTPYYEKITNTHLITDAKYNQILRLLRTKAKTSERGNTRKLRLTYQLVGNVENRCIYRKGKVVTTFERVFDAILEAHSSIGHSRDFRKHKSFLSDNLNYFGIPGPAVQMFINTCPTVSKLQLNSNKWLLLLLTFYFVPFLY